MSAVREPIKLQFVANVLSLHSVDTANQTFNVEVVIRARTVGVPNARTRSGEPVTIDNWEPRIRLLNKVDESKWEMSKKPAPGGEIELKWTIAGSYSQRFELSDFPGDRQDLSLSISSAIPRYAFGPKAPDDPEVRDEVFHRIDAMTDLEKRLGSIQQNSETELEALKSKLASESEWLQVQIASGILIEVLRFEPWPGKASVVQTENFCMSAQWSLNNLLRMCSSQTYARSSTTMTIRPLIVMSLSVTRRRGAAFWNIEMPMGVITALGAVTFVIEKSSADRLSVSVTLLLTAVAYKLMISADLPKISYLTALDKYVITCFIALAVVVVENALCEWQRFGDLDIYFALGWVISFVLFMLAYGITACMRTSRAMCEEQQHEEVACATSRIGVARAPRPAGESTSSSTPLISK
eukprot:TRINITY_DN58073_c0_g1_i1.p1 TRINITY_DN58073_c0_g1~~TRINITY_DN58073_c0_g1_i1.p1  ORF type:complete len:432 (+),score=36.53 TRINITY_DN58073_c0_g1_i1:66-1298(+)